MWHLTINVSLHASHERCLCLLASGSLVPVPCLTRDKHTINICYMNKSRDLRTLGQAQSCRALVLEYSSNSIRATILCHFLFLAYIIMRCSFVLVHWTGSSWKPGAVWHPFLSSITSRHLGPSPEHGTSKCPISACWNARGLSYLTFMSLAPFV